MGLSFDLEHFTFRLLYSPDVLRSFMYFFDDHVLMLTHKMNGKNTLSARIIKTRLDIEIQVE